MCLNRQHRPQNSNGLFHTSSNNLLLSSLYHPKGFVTMSQCWETYFSSISKKLKNSYVRSSDQELTKSYYLYHLGLMFTHEARTEPYLISDSWSEVKWSEVKSLSCGLTLGNPMDCSLPGSSVHGILQARILEWVTISFSRGSSRPRDQSWISHIGGRCFNLWATREAR